MLRYFIPECLLALALAGIIGCTPSSEVTVPSPDGKLKLTLCRADSSLAISVSYKGKQLLMPSPIGLVFQDGSFGGMDVEVSKGPQTRIEEEYDLPTGKTSHVSSVSNQRVVTLTDAGGRVVELCLRAFDDGVAYRYVFPGQDTAKLLIKEELMDIRPKGNPMVKAMYIPWGWCSHEDVYLTDSLSRIHEERSAEMPVLLTFESGANMAITEAMVVDYAGMRMAVDNGVLRGRLTPRLDKPDLCVVAQRPSRSPWRVFIVSERIGAVMESDILTSLCDPCTDTDLSWLRPGKATWPWWNGYQCSAGWKGDVNTINYNLSREYIDFCAQNGIEYHSISGIMLPNGEEVPWYYNENHGVGAAFPADCTAELYPGFDLPAISAYAHEKGVGLRVWVHWETLSKDIEGTFRQFRLWGIDGMMVDFMNRDDQEMMDFQKRVLQLAMKYHLHIQFHGASKPSGLSRTYPCEFTRENTCNYEVYKWDGNRGARQMGADHDLNIPFTRSLAGPADYHLGGFVSVLPENFSASAWHPVVTSTRAHMLAMYVVLESTLQLVCDSPEHYAHQPGFDFICQVPTTWDETRVLQGAPDEYVVIARRKGREWYVGCIGNHEARDISLPLDFLGDGEYVMQLYTDAFTADKDPNQLDMQQKGATKSDRLSIHLAPDGGFAAHLVP
ncbi:MAG: glycoside hydrolase family 97 protein [Bacteroidaceae bacterium]|nr:glycoside hydrolase family 97 protein [Bacteroidaceae bacterium]